MEGGERGAYTHNTGSDGVTVGGAFVGGEWVREGYKRNKRNTAASMERTYDRGGAYSGKGD